MSSSIKLSRTFDEVDSREMGLKLSGWHRSPPLWIGGMADCFHSYGTVACSREWVESSCRNGVTVYAQDLRNRGGMSSSLADLCGRRAASFFEIVSELSRAAGSSEFPVLLSIARGDSVLKTEWKASQRASAVCELLSVKVPLTRRGATPDLNFVSEAKCLYSSFGFRTNLRARRS